MIIDGQQRSVRIQGLQMDVFPVVVQIAPVSHTQVINGSNAITSAILLAEGQVNRLDVLGQLFLYRKRQGLADITGLFGGNVSETKKRLIAGNQANQPYALQRIATEGLLDLVPAFPFSIGLLLSAGIQQYPIEKPAGGFIGVRRDIFRQRPGIEVVWHSLASLFYQSVGSAVTEH